MKYIHQKQAKHEFLRKKQVVVVFFLNFAVLHQKFVLALCTQCQT